MYVNNTVSDVIHHLAIRQRVRVVFERIVNEGGLSDCFSIHHVPRYINFEKIIVHRNYAVIFKIV